MLEKLNLSSFTKNYQDIDRIVKELPENFGVSNMTQVLFRVFLLKPYIWQQVMHEAVVKSIKGLQNDAR